MLPSAVKDIYEEALTFMKKKRFTYLIFVMFSLMMVASCRKYGKEFTLHVMGNVYDKDSGMPLDSVILGFAAHRRPDFGEISFDPGGTIPQSFYPVDSNGTFSFEFYKDNDRIYTLIFDRPGYDVQEVNIDPDSNRVVLFYRIFL
jgi:hypothetical protein